jgi:hypothetical protein
MGTVCGPHLAHGLGLLAWPSGATGLTGPCQGRGVGAVARWRPVGRVAFVVGTGIARGWRLDRRSGRGPIEAIGPRRGGGGSDLRQCSVASDGVRWSVQHRWREGRGEA